MNRIRVLDKKTAVVCPDGRMFLQNHEPSYCKVGTPGRKLVCGDFYWCERCYRVFCTCVALKIHQKKYHKLC